MNYTDFEEFLMYNMERRERGDLEVTYLEYQRTKENTDDHQR